MGYRQQVAVTITRAMTGPSMNRRDFFRRSAHLALGVGVASQLGWLAACTTRDGNAGPVAPIGPGDDAWAQLGRALRGGLYRPGDPPYSQLALPFNLRWSDVKPAGIAQVADAADVATAIGWARDHDVELVARSGGHSYAGFSTIAGLHIDLTAMTAVQVDQDAGRATVAGGARNLNLYAALEPASQAISAGRCVSVGVAGLTLGGGFGFSARKLGLTCDVLTETELVTADGEVLTCNERENPDLFWALRGGGGGNFGINTSFTFDLTPVGDVTVYEIGWDHRHLAAVFDAFERIMATAPDDFSVRLAVKPDNRLAGLPGGVTALGQHFGSEAELRDILAPALAAAAPASTDIREVDFFVGKTFLQEGANPAFSIERSRVANAPLTTEAVETIVAALDRWPGGSSDASAQLAVFAWGGAIGAVAPDATAFVHRDAFSVNSIQYEWGPEDPIDVVRDGLVWVDETLDVMQEFVTPYCYQNFLDVELDDPLHAYYGANLDRLIEIKAAVDPDDVFHFPQSIPVR